MQMLYLILRRRSILILQKALITGGSSGIGFELAKVMAQNGHDLVLVARKKQDLEQAKKEINKKFSVDVQTVTCDLSKPKSAQELHNKTKDMSIEILINNAGVGLVGDFFETDLERNTSMMRLNMTSLVELTHLFGNQFIAQNSGRILNIASITAFFPGPKQPVYYATKAFVRSFSRALAYDLRNTDVTVTALHPGVTKTKFFITADASFFKGGASPESVAELGYKAMMKGQIEVTHGLRNKILTNVFTRIIPYRLQTILVDKSSKV